MGIFLRNTALLCALSMFFSLQAQVAEAPLFASVEAKFIFLQPPRVKVESSSSLNRGTLVLNNRRWGAVQFSFKPTLKTYPVLNANLLRRKLWLNDVTCGVTVILCDRKNTKAPALALYSTSFDFWSVPLDYRPHKYFVYLPPLLIERAMPLRRAGAKGVTLATEKDFIVRVIFLHKKWGVIGQGFAGLSGRPREVAADFKILSQLVPKEQVFHGSILSRARSPWSQVDQEQFDLEKPAYIPAPLDDAAIEKAAAIAAQEEAVSVDRYRKNAKSTNSKKSKKYKK